MIEYCVHLITGGRKDQKKKNAIMLDVRKRANQEKGEVAAEQSAMASQAPIKFKRAYHTKARTGCKTCK